MLFLGGLVFVFLCVFGSFAASGGAVGPLIMAMPFEFLCIAGAAVGIFVMGNSKSTLEHFPYYVKMCIRGPRYDKDAYIELLVTLFRFTRLAHTKGSMALEEHIENPEESSIFALAPGIRDDIETRDFICDYLRLVSLSVDDPHQVDDIMVREIKKNTITKLHTSESLQNVADALPALGIIAAVLGVIKTMAAISKPPVILGEMIGDALVGTFLGILLSYGVAAPFSAKIREVVTHDSRYHDIIRIVIVAHLNGAPPQISAEIGRKDIPKDTMPSFNELETALTESTQAHPPTTGTA